MTPEELKAATERAKRVLRGGVRHPDDPADVAGDFFDLKAERDRLALEMEHRIGDATAEIRKQEQEQRALVKELREENERLRTGGIIEVAVENLNVQHYMEHWEGRAERAEEENERLRAERQSWRSRLGLSTQDEMVTRAVNAEVRIEAALAIPKDKAFDLSEGEIIEWMVKALKGEER